MVHQCFFKSRNKGKYPSKEQCKSSDTDKFATAVADIIIVSRLCNTDDIHIQLRN